MLISKPSDEICSPSITIGPPQLLERQHAPERGEEIKPLRGFKGFWNRWRLQIKLLIALLFPILLEALDYTVVASAQPRIASSFNRLDLQSWIGTSYILTSTSFLPVFANLMNIFGRYAVIQLALSIFAIGSALSTAAQNMPMLLAGRGISGVGAAALLTVRPLIGGLLVSVSFRWIFAINLPIAVASSILTRKSNKHKFLVQLSEVDWIGSFVFVSALLLILLGLNWGSTQEWNQGKVIVTLVTGGMLVLAFLAWELYLGRYEVIVNADGTIRSSLNPDSSIVSGEHVLPKKPSCLVTHTVRMLPLHIFEAYNVAAISIACLAGGMLMFGCLYVIAIYFNIAVGYSSARAGTQLVWFNTGLGPGFCLSMAITRRLKQPKYAVAFGQLLQPIGTGLLGMATANNYMSEIIVFQVLCGISIGMTLGVTDMVAQFALASKHTILVVTMNLFVSSFSVFLRSDAYLEERILQFVMAGGTIGLAQQSAVLQSKVRSYINYLESTHQISLSDAITIMSNLGSLDQGKGYGIDQLPSRLKSFVQEAYGHGTSWAFYSIIPWLAIGALPCLFLDDVQVPEDTGGDITTEEHKNDESQGVSVARGDEHRAEVSEYVRSSWT
ncbi:major facilitator superfamily domain-containing protein [Cantharellus anzutake]|uniref:major facilitator superfamily domain-containing protein n=1 Tax=Cantharellus anzutake TaxID=1750568 RepID=UPI0019055E25|nr:major facilitator superfamily domain-containing protein [Cantharellus anzutake]KAF8334317.1 major facilitator superfamily domain-containing protein [Cantharellus anzutake]